MKILVVTQYYYPEDFRINDICEELARRGNSVTVVTGRPNYPKGEVFAGYEDSHKAPSIINGVTVYRCKNRPRKKGLVNLLFSYISFSREASKLIKKMDDDFDVVYAYQMSPITLVIPAIKYKKLHNKPLYVYVCDVWPESVKDLGNNKSLSVHNPVFLFFKNLSKRIYKQADMIGVKCNEFIDYLTEACKVDKTKCFLNYEHAESNYLKVLETPINNGIIDFMYLGNLGHSSNCDLILKATTKLTDNSFKIHFVGTGSEYDYLVKLTKEMQLDEKVVFHGRVPQNKVIDFYNFADVCLLTLKGDSFVGLTPPAKLPSYMAACRPIIASINGASKTIIREANCGYVCPADDVDAFANLLMKTIENYDVLSMRRLGLNGRNYFCSHLTLDMHVSTLLIHLGELNDTFSNRK